MPAGAAREAFTETNVSQRAFRDALGRFATGVTVVTAFAPEGTRLGATVSSFNSVSLDPPLILFSMARAAKAFPDWARVDGFVVNMLDEDQHALSDQFARPLSDKWQGMRVAAAETISAPSLAEAFVRIECRTHAIHDGGDHAIILGRVTALHRRETGNQRPLVSFRGAYRRLAAD